MPPIIPTRYQDQLDFYASRAPVWAEHAAAIGLTPEAVAAFTTLAAAARASYAAKLSAEEAARIATAQLREDLAAAHTSCAGLIRLIKAFADSTDAPAAIYNLAQIPLPAPPSPAPPPAKPTGLSADLDAPTGALRLRWKATNPRGTQGTTYIIRRRTDPRGEFTFVGATGSKAFLDDTLPAGLESVQYTVQGQRAGSTGPLSDIFTVNFGTSSPATTAAPTTSAVTPPTPARLAA